MKLFLYVISFLGSLIFLIISLIKIEDPFKLIDGYTIFSISYPKFLVIWVGICIIYLSIIWSIYVILNKLKAFKNKKNT